jgi:glutathione S-transferase
LIRAGRDGCSVGAVNRPTLYIGNKNYSSWSLRPWLALHLAGIEFEEVLIPLGGDGYGRGRIAAVKAVSPSGRIPALRIGEVTVWDSLAICEWAAEQRPHAGLWPDDITARAVCRSVVCEMHSGFASLRNEFGMNLRRRTGPREGVESTRDDLARITALWAETRATWGRGGDHLFGARTLADVFFTPVATRVRTYGLTLDRASMAYVETLLADRHFRAWEAAAEAEPWRIEETERL